ncbi:MAG: hypothetical protein ACK5YR_09950 [Pirellula sp.]
MAQIGSLTLMCHVIADAFWHGTPAPAPNTWKAVLYRKTVQIGGAAGLGYGSSNTAHRLLSVVFTGFSLQSTTADFGLF